MADPFSKNDRNYQGKTAGPALKFERPDFTLFRTVEGLQQKAGVPARRLRRLVLKELADNAHDTRTAVDIGALGPGSFYVEDRGPGIDGTPEEIAGLFSIGRPLRSTKLLRLPMRGALGNGLRVVAGAVLASRGSLVIITRNRQIVVQPERDGSSKVVEVAPVGHSVGTRIEIAFEAALPADNDTLAWARLVSQVAQHGNEYDGRTSPHWYDPAQFHELLDATGARPVRELLAKLEGCTGATAGKIVNVPTDAGWPPACASLLGGISQCSARSCRSCDRNTPLPCSQRPVLLTTALTPRRTRPPFDHAGDGLGIGGLQRLAAKE